MTPVNLLNVNYEEFQLFLNSFDHVLSDCDGVLWFAGKIYPGVGEFFRLMRESGKSVHFASNNSIRSEESYKKLFDDAGIPVGVDNLTIPSRVMAEYLKSINFDKHIYCVTCPEAIKMFTSYGFKTKYGPDVSHDNFADFTEYLIDDPDIGAVAFDYDYKANMSKMYKASTYLKRPEVLFLNGPMDKFVKFAKQLAIGVAWPSEVVSSMVKRDPLEMAKPSKHYGECAMRRAGGTDPSRVLVIGDTVVQDIGLGKNMGFKTLLVLTHSTEEEMRAHVLQPDFYAPSLGCIVSKFTQ